MLSISGPSFLFLRFGFLARVGLVGLGLVSWLVFICCFLRVGFRGLVFLGVGGFTSSGFGPPILIASVSGVVDHGCLGWVGLVVGFKLS